MVKSMCYTTRQCTRPQVWIVMCREIDMLTQSLRENFHTKTVIYRADLEQPELPCLTKWNPWDRSPDSYATFWREATNPEVLRTFDSGRSPSLIVGHLEPAIRLDKRGKHCTDGIRDGLVAASSIFVYNVVKYASTPTSHVMITSWILL